MEKIFNKLVRDNIPNIIESNNEESEIRILNEKEYKIELLKKLKEEYNEVLDSNSDNFLEELADMLEVIDALSKTQGKTLDDILKVKEAKKQSKGSFDKKIYLIKTYTKTNHID